MSLASSADTEPQRPAEPPAAAGRWRWAAFMLMLSRLSLWFVAIALVLTVAGSWCWPGISERLWWPIELLNYFVFTVRTLAFQIGLGVLVMMLLALALKQWKLAAFVLVPMSAFLLLPEAFWLARTATPPAAAAAPAASSSPPLSTDRPDIIIYSHNTYLGRIDPLAVAATARANDADIVIVQEAGAPIAHRLREILADTHPHFAHEPQSAVYGHAMFSRLPFEEPSRCVIFAEEPLERHMFRMHSDDGQQRIVLRVSPEKKLIIQNIHLVSPSDPAAVAEQDRQVLGLLATLNKEHLLQHDAPPTLIIGDFNATPRSVTHSRFRAARLREVHALVGQGRGTTWPAHSRWLPVGLGVRIDNAFINHTITPRFSKVLPNNNSDHQGILIGLDLTPAN